MKLKCPCGYVFRTYSYRRGTDENIKCGSVDCRKKSITRLETTVMMETTVCTTVGIDHCQDRKRCQDRDPLSGWR